MEFDGKRWVSVPEPVVGEAVRLSIIDLYTAEAKAQVHPDRLRAISSLFSVSRIFAIVRIAKGYLFVHAEEFDAHPDLLNVNNGVVDLRDGTLAAHDPALRFTKLCPTDYIPGATHADWAKALAALPDAEVRVWLQIRLGQSITGYPTPDDVMVFLNGGGENGKTTVVDAIRQSLGCDYAVTLPDRVLLANTGDHPTELMTLWGARLAFMEELPDQHLNIKRLKDTHGTGRMSARYCGKDNVEWDPTHSIFVTTNHLPRIDEPEHAVWRRLAMAVFPYRYRKANEPIEGPMDRRGDGGLRGRLRNPRSKRQHEAVLAWLIEGAVKWYQNNQEMPDPPAVVEAAKETWRVQVDVLLRYIAEELIPDPTHHIAGVNIYQHCAQWLAANGYTVWADQTFAARFGEHPRIQAKGITKKQVRKRAQGQTLSHRDVWVNGKCQRTVPNRYWAWVGVRFRDSTDVFGPDDTNGW
jgi:putative DNA primase/helicase